MNPNESGLVTGLLFVGVLLVGVVPALIWYVVRHHRPQRRSERDRVLAALLVVAGLLVLPLGALLGWGGVAIAAMFVAWTAAFVLWVAAAGVTQREHREARRQGIASLDSHAASELGRYVDGRWVCFEHEQRWCPFCSARARRPGETPASPSVEEAQSDTAT